MYTDIQNAYVFKTQGVPIWTNKDKVTGEPVYEDAITGEPVNVKGNNTQYILREIDDNFNGTLLPTIGLIIKI